MGVKLRQFPILREEVMPTRIGNTIRAGETRPWHWYGLDTVIVWPQLWLVLPQRVCGDVTTARRQLARFSTLTGSTSTTPSTIPDQSVPAPNRNMGGP